MGNIDYKEIFDKNIHNLIKLIQIPSVYDEKSITDEMPCGKYVNEALDFMRKLALNDGFEVLEYDNHAIAIRFNEEDERIDIASHLDVVEIGSGWNDDPFSGKIIDGKLFGRGTQDMKTCAFLTYLALKMIKDNHIALKREVRIVYGTDEERTMNDMRYYLQKASQPTFAFTPDGAFPMGIGEKGALMWTLEGHYEGIVEEIDAGIQCNVISPIASCIIRDISLKKQFDEYIDEHDIDASVYIENDLLHINVKGKAAHCSRPNLGHSATIDLLMLLKDICKEEAFINLYDLFSDAYGRGCGLSYDDELMGPLTMNLGILRLKNHTFEGQIDCRYPYGLSSKDLSDKLQKCSIFKISLPYDDKPTLESENNIFVKALLDNYRDKTKDYSNPRISGGVSYSKVFEHCVSYGPDNGKMENLAHQANEHIELEYCSKLLEIYYNAIISLANI